MFNYH